MYAANRYKADEAQTATPGELLIMLYDGIVRFLRQAEAAVGDGSQSRTSAAITKAIDIIQYLQATLQDEDYPELSEDLDRMYSSWTSVLLRAHARRDGEAIAAIRGQAASLRETWAEVNQSLGSAQEPGTGA